MRPIIGDGAVVPHIIIIIKRVCIVREACASTSGMLRHIPVFAVRTFVEEELLIMVS